MRANAACEQMKKRYTTLRPYGEWLAEQAFSLEDAVASVSPQALASPNGASANGTSAPASSNGTRQGFSCWLAAWLCVCKLGDE